MAVTYLGKEPTGPSSEVLVNYESALLAAVGKELGDLVISAVSHNGPQITGSGWSKWGAQTANGKEYADWIHESTWDYSNFNRSIGMAIAVTTTDLYSSYPTGERSTDGLGGLGTLEVHSGGAAPDFTHNSIAIRGATYPLEVKSGAITAGTAYTIPTINIPTYGFCVVVCQPVQDAGWTTGSSINFTNSGGNANGWTLIASHNGVGWKGLWGWAYYEGNNGGAMPTFAHNITATTGMYMAFVFGPTKVNRPKFRYDLIRTSNNQYDGLGR